MIRLPDVTAIYVIVAFLASLAILKRYLFVPLTAILEEREREAASASQVLADSHAKLRIEGRTHLERRLEEARGAAEQAVAKGNEEIGRAASSSSATLPRSARELARVLAEKILGRAIAA